MKTLLTWLTIVVVASSCTTASDPLEQYEELTPIPIMEPPPSQAANPVNSALIEQGRYMIELIGCAACHTNGALNGDPDFDQWLAGSDTGIAYTNPMKYDMPGVVFPSNLTPDPGTGIGNSSDDEITSAIRAGSSRHGLRQIVVMPWLAYSKLSDADTAAIVAYLRSLPPVEHKVPDYVPPDTSTSERFVHFGIYRSLP